jgi:hypothetical protein
MFPPWISLLLNGASMLTGLSNQPADPVDYPVASPCLERGQAIMARIAANTATPEDMAFAAAVQAHPEQFQYSNADCTQYSANPLPVTPPPTTAGFSLSDIPWWGWALLAFGLNEAGVFGKNDLQVLDL